MDRELDWLRIIFIFVGIICGILVFFYFDASPGALRLLFTVFSIFAGMLIAIISLLGDPDSVFPGSWRIASAHSRALKHVLKNYVALLYVYLATIILAFLGCLEGTLDTDIFARAAQGVGAASLFWSICLPHALYKAQADRLDEEVKQRHDNKVK